jgi:hypothetical protein
VFFELEDSITLTKSFTFEVTGLAFLIEDPQARISIVALGIYIFIIAYSPGMGPVPFSYSAEVYPLYLRDLGMSLSTSILW